MDIGAWLSRLGLEQYEAAFHNNDIDAEVLPRLTAEDLIDIGITSVGHRRKLLEAAAMLRADASPVAASMVRRAGARLEEPEGERREVAVLFADLEGYTALSKTLEAEDIHTLLERFFDRVDHLVQAHGGHIDKHIGDCVMAVFGAPTSHGNDIERATRAALAIQEAMPVLSQELGRQIRVHIGIAGGEVIASGSGSALHREYTVTGDTVNLASRMTDAAGPGEILVSDSIRRALIDRLECVADGELTIKGVANSVRTWRPLKFRTAEASKPRPLIGREDELGHFRAALDICRSRGRGHAIYIRGEAGIGKTRLLEEFQTIARRAGFGCHAGLVLDFGAGSGKDAVRALVRSLLGLANASDRRSAKQAAQRAISVGLVSVARHVFLNDLLDLPQPIELRALYSAMENAARNRGKRETIAELVMKSSSSQPRLLTVEDLHWASPAILDQLSTLTETIAECPAILVMTSRTEGDQLDTTWQSSVQGLSLTTLDIGPLRLSEAEMLVSSYRNTLGDLVQRCIARAEGNPLFLEHLLRHAEESAESRLPASIQGLVQARLDRLAPIDKQALQAASVLGQRFSLETLGALLGQPGYDCQSLVRNLLLKRQDDQFLFAHALIQEGVYRSLLRARQRELHRRAAGWFKSRDETLYAEHLDRADDPGAAAAYLAAARSQAAQYRAGTALRLVERGISVARDRVDTFSLTPR